MSLQAGRPLRAALVVNPRARRVTTGLLRILRAHIAPSDLFLCRDLCDLDAVVAHCRQGNYDIVACAGGDGTLAAVVNRLCAAKLPVLPLLAALPLGTGNALAHWVAHPSLQHNLSRLAQLRTDAPVATKRLALVCDQAGRRMFFAGMGLDSLLLGDFNRVRQAARNRVPARLVGSLAGYLYALATRTLPTLVCTPLPLHAEVRTLDTAWYFDARANDVPRPIAAGTCLWHGPLALLAVGTSPLYGYGLRLFPFAERLQGMMQLRLAAMGPWSILAHLPHIWHGTWRHPLLKDFAVTKLDIRLRAPFGWQAAGDELGLVDRLRLSMAPESLSLVDLRLADHQKARYP